MANDIAKEIPLFLSALNSLKSDSSDSDSHIKGLIEKVVENDKDRSKGLSFLEMKFHLVLDYLINLTYSMILKLSGKSLVDQPCIERLVEIRTVLEKVRPINKKLSYQIDKLIKMVSSTEGQNNPLSFKPNLDNLVNKDDDLDGSEDDGGDESKNKDVYVPPRVTAVPYEEEDKTKKKADKARQRSLNNALLQDLRDEYSEAPEEMRYGRNSNAKAKLQKKEDEREQFEEDNFRRLTVTKKDRMMKRKLDDLDSVIKIDSFNHDDDSASDDDGAYRPNKKKSKGKKKDKFRQKALGKKKRK